ncbi:MAG: hypothetical protein MJY74_02280 [Bacteroidaceae bacterium]|nr:hypothetical protein [Bacteroidaceae bacterium]
MKSVRNSIVSICLIFCTACTNIPDCYTDISGNPEIFPDNINVTIPCNIAPLAFCYKEQAEKYITSISSGNTEYIVKGRNVVIPAKKWNKLKDSSNQITITSYVQKNGQWNAYKSFSYFVSADTIDKYLSYRLIPPGFENFNELKLIVRDLESYGEREFYSNRYLQEPGKAQCMNCHYFRNYKTDQMQIHVRQYLGGTMLFNNGNVRKINLKNDSTISNGVYTAWNPKYDYIAYTTNSTFEDLHNMDHNLIEVLDDASQLILYDINQNTVSMVSSNKNTLACYPVWSTDGKRLYYTLSHMPYSGSDEPGMKTTYFYNHSSEIHYDLMYKDFDPETKKWGKEVKVIDAAKLGKSITLPRVSPDGRYLMFSMGTYGVFHIWHHESDLYLLDLETGTYNSIASINSNYAESYHSWSSTGNWVVFSTRREDAGYTRLYIAHHNGDGTFDKPFALPTKNPQHSTFLMYSYNIPEFSIEDIPYTAKELAKMVKEMSVEFIPYHE